MGLYTDVEFMLRRSSVSKLKVNKTLREFKNTIKEHGDGKVYKSLSNKVKYNLCCSRILQGDLSSWSGWQYRDEWAETMRYGIQSDVKFWNGGLEDSLVIIGEQGIGDEVMFSSIIPESMIRCKKVTYCCDERLIPILERSFGKCGTFHARTRYVDVRDDLLYGDYTAYIPAGDLLPFFRRRKADFPRKPFLKVNQERVKEFEKYRGMVGISWRGRHGQIDPEDFHIDNAVSLQYDYQHPAIETPSIDLRKDIEGVFALISVLSKVVCVPTSVFHFAGAIGIPSEIIIAPKNSELEIDGIVDELDWHVPLGESQWYPNSTVYNSLGDWYKR